MKKCTLCKSELRKEANIYVCTNAFCGEKYIESKLVPTKINFRKPLDR